MNLNVTELFISNLLGLFIGLGTSFFSWWVLFHVLVPKVEFSDAISRTPRRNGSGHSYRLKLMNTGRRAVIGLEIFVRVTYKIPNTTNTTGIYIPVRSDGESKLEIPRLNPKANRLIYLRPNLVSTFRTSTIYSQAFRERAAKGKLTIEDVLALGTAAKLKVYVSGYDEFSGARKVFVSKDYTVSDTISGWFKGLTVRAEQTEAAEVAEIKATNLPSGDGD